VPVLQTGEAGSTPAEHFLKNGGRRIQQASTHSGIG